jgi:ribosomal protein S18 acetylase RimI-like enzyme
MNKGEGIMDSKFEIVTATIKDIDGISYLLNQYRIFYKQERNLEACRSFLQDRLARNDSAIFYARHINGSTKEPVGFVQLYPSFSTVSLKRLWILNDLYVEKKYRRMGIARQLLKKAENHARETGSKGLMLETSQDNHKAQQLYESLGWEKDEEFFHYHLIF